METAAQQGNEGTDGEIGGKQGQSYKGEGEGENGMQDEIPIITVESGLRELNKPDLQKCVDCGLVFFGFSNANIDAIIFTQRGREAVNDIGVTAGYQIRR